MRLVPELTPLTSTDTRAKFEWLRTRQENFCKHVVRATTWELGSIDYKDPTMNKSLRHLTMQIKAREKPHLTLFHSIDRHWQGNGHVATFIPQFEAEARMILAGLLPFLLHYHPNHEEQLLKFFSDPDKERLGEVTWDPVKYCIVTPDDIAVDSLMEGDDEFDCHPASRTTAPPLLRHRVNKHWSVHLLQIWKLLLFTALTMTPFLPLQRPPPLAPKDPRLLAAERQPIQLQHLKITKRVTSAQSRQSQSRQTNGLWLSSHR